MRTAKAILLGLILTSLMVPFAGCIDFIGAVNYIPGRGGTVNFAENFTATSLSPLGSLWRWTTLMWPGTNVGTFAIDASAGSTVLVTGMTSHTLTYTVTAAGAESQYIHYRGLQAKIAGVAGGTAVVLGTYLLRVDTAGVAAVTVSYGFGGGGQVSDSLNAAQIIALSLIPLLILTVIVEDFKADLVGYGTVWKIIMITLIFGAMAWMFRGWGY